MTHNSDKPIVVKIGGSTLGSHDTTIQDLVYLQKTGLKTVVVHGGGKTITEWLSKQKTPTSFVRGLRVTDAQSLEVVAAVLAGLINKQLVASIYALGGKAAGLSGVDGALIEARKSDPALGYVGEIARLNLELLDAIMGSGLIPVIAPLGISLGDEPGKATLLNLNADTVAGELAAALGAEKLVFLTDVGGVQNRSGKVVSCLLPEEAATLMATGVIASGMVPKVQSCLKVLSSGLSAYIVDGREPRALAAVLEGRETGTRIGQPK